MKKWYTSLFITFLVCVAGTVVFLIISPDRVPMHYSFAGEVDRFGSKYENLIFPLFAVVLSAFFVFMGRREGKKGQANNEKVMMITGVFTMIFFTLLGFYFMWKAVKYDPASSANVSVDDVYRFTSIGIGALMILGNIMPKARRNGTFGVRTKWSMANDSVWQKSQRFGGIALMTAGFVMIVLSLFIPGAWNLLSMAVVIVAALIVTVSASHRYYLEDKEKTAS